MSSYAPFGYPYGTNFSYGSLLGGTDWLHPEYVADVGTREASTSIPHTGSFGASKYLIVKNLGISIPSNGTVDGFELIVNRKCINFEIEDQAIRIIDNGTLWGQSRALVGTWGNVMYAAKYGTLTDCWNVSAPLTPAIVNNVNFGIGIKVWNPNMTLDDTAYVDSIYGGVAYH